jgi:antitoxin component YwqK of YwqJK toxin-antitoxin module
MKSIDDLYTAGDKKTGETIYYEDKNLSKLFTGIIYDEYDGFKNWLFEVDKGLQNGIEKVFHEGTDILDQIVEYKDNLQFGISKEFDDQGELS